MKRAIVLSGGGAKGSYQIGVWRALRKLGIKYDIITGTSVGSLNGALMVQNTYFRGLWFWLNIKYKNIFNDGFNIDHNIICDNKGVIKKYISAVFKNRGMDASKLEDNIEKVIDENRIRKSKIDFGLVTYNLTNLKPITLTKSEIPKGKLKDYLMASATCFPAFKKKNIGDSNYIDGGYYDNLPINLAIAMGAEEIIAVDLKAIGIKRKVKDKNIKITYIAPKNDLGFFLVFHKNLARRGIRLGYNDTMKAFDKLDGNIFTFKPNDLKVNMERYKDFYTKCLTNTFQENEKDNIISKLFKLTTYKKGIKKNDFNNTIEYLGKIFELDDSYIYDIDRYNEKIIDRFDEMPIVDKSLIEQKIKDKDIKGLINTKNFIKYIYDKIEYSVNNNIANELLSISVLLPKEFLGALYLYTIKNSD